MAISQRTATVGTVAAAAAFSISLPTGTSVGDFLVVGISNASNLATPAAPTGWTRSTFFSAGNGQGVAVFTAAYSAGLTLNFTNSNSAAAWACNAYFESTNVISLDGSVAAASNTGSTTAMVTGAPVTSVAGDYEVLVYSWALDATIVAASGMTIDQQQANSTTIAVALGHNNINPLGAAVTCTAFAPSLSVANNRKTGIGVLLKSVFSGTTVTPDAISTGEQVYPPSIVLVSPQNVTPNAITTAEAVYQPSVLLAAQSVTPDAISSAEVVYAPDIHIVLPPIVVSPLSIASAVAVYSPTVVVVPRAPAPPLVLAARALAPPYHQAVQGPLPPFKSSPHPDWPTLRLVP
jgi:hypothetical protein